MSPAPSPPAPRYTVAGHRRRWPRTLLRRAELLAWVLASVVAGGVVALILTTTAATRSAPPPVAPPSAAAVWAPEVAAACIFDPCDRPAPTGEPTRLRIAAIDVDAAFETLKLDEHHQLTAPISYERVGWLPDGVVPGDPGPAVIAGHVNSVRGPAVFAQLGTLPVGALIEVQRGGQWLAFRVTDVKQYPKNQFPAGEVYQPTPDAELRLITCGGDFDSNRLSYRDNIVVFAVIA